MEAALAELAFPHGGWQSWLQVWCEAADSLMVEGMTPCQVGALQYSAPSERTASALS